MRQEYFFGSAARQLTPVELPDSYEQERLRRRQEQQEQERIRRIREQKRRERAFARQHRINLIYTLVSFAVVGLMFVACVQYLEAQAAVNSAVNEVSVLEARLTQLTVQNDETQMQIDGSIDYDEIFRVATEELGMKYPSYSQVIEYDSSESEYVKQYKNIPSQK
jgi:cell division protein FtsL